MTSTTFTIPNPKSDFIDPQTGKISRDWFIYLQNLLNAVGSGTVGTTTQVLHGGGAGYGQVALTQDVIGILPSANGGTGVNNGVNSITLGSNFTLSGSSPLIISVTASSSVVMPASGTLLTRADVGTIASQNASNVTITGGTVSVGAIFISGNNVVGNLPGTSTNDNANAGNVGEIITSTVTSGAALSLSNATAKTIASILLTAGDWDVTGVVDYVASGATTSDFKSGSSNTNNTFGSQDSFVNLPLIATTLSDTIGHPIPLFRYSISTGNVSTYLIGQANFSLGSATAYGTIRARRVR